MFKQVNDKQTDWRAFFSGNIFEGFEILTLIAAIIISGIIFRQVKYFESLHFDKKFEILEVLS